MRIRIAAVLLLVVTLSIPSFLGIFTIDARAASTQVIFQYDFDDYQLPDKMTSPFWEKGDWDLNNGTDYWDCSSYRYHAGGRSAWCAYAGTNWKGIGNSLTHTYDQNMGAYLRLPLNISEYEAVSMAFYFWSACGDGNTGDYLALNLRGDSGIWWQAWVQPFVNSTDWQQIQINVPTNSTCLEFNFTSDGIVGIWWHEGAYIDDLVISGTDSLPPVSSVVALPIYTPNSHVKVQFNCSDTGGSGVDFVELYFQKNGSGAYLKYTAPNNTAGQWNSGPIFFNSTAVGRDGHYRFYSVATDRFGNKEVKPSIEEAGTIVDTTEPWGSVTYDGSVGENGWYRSVVNVTLSPDDKTSGLADVHYMVSHGGTTMVDWSPYYLQSVTISEEGKSIVFFNMTDNATNTATRRCYVNIDTVAPVSEINLTGEPGENCWYKGPAVTVNITATDNTSGISSIRYSIDGGTWHNYSGDFLVDEGGFRNISFYATDGAGNPGPNPVTIMLKLDTAGPVCTLLNPPFVANSNIVALSWQAEDNVSGIAFYEISIDDNPFTALGINETNLEANLADGQHTFKVRAIDMAGNTGTPAEVTFSVDTNVLSLTGPFGPVLDIGIVVLIIALVALFMLRRKKLEMPSEKKEKE
jgi:hypothetical protein